MNKLLGIVLTFQLPLAQTRAIRLRLGGISFGRSVPNQIENLRMIKATVLVSGRFTRRLISFEGSKIEHVILTVQISEMKVSYIGASCKFFTPRFQVYLSNQSMCILQIKKKLIFFNFVYGSTAEKNFVLRRLHRI